MGLNFFGRSFSKYDTYSSGTADNTTNALPNPDPNNYEILKTNQMLENLVIEIKYLDCTNYEGRKILVYKNTTLKKLMAQKTIDPHFSNNLSMLSPFARFEPTEEGWNEAVKFAANLALTRKALV